MVKKRIAHQQAYLVDVASGTKFKLKLSTGNDDEMISAAQYDHDGERIVCGTTKVRK